MNPDGKSHVQALWRIPQWFPSISEPMQGRLRAFHEQLLRFNAKVNLISKASEREADEIHFSDCILGSQLVLQHAKSPTLFDIGSGNGLPGIILGILDPQRKIYLVESDLRKGEFLKQMIFQLEFSNIEVLTCRFESLPVDSIDAAVSRGFSSISKAITLGNKLFRKNSGYYHFKTNIWSREVAQIPSQLCAFWSPELVGDYVLPDSQARRAIICTKKSG